MTKRYVYSVVEIQTNERDGHLSFKLHGTYVNKLKAREQFAQMYKTRSSFANEITDFKSAMFNNEFSHISIVSDTTVCTIKLIIQEVQ